MELKDILYKIKVENNDSYYHELLQNKDVRRHIRKIVNRYRLGKNQYYFNEELIRGIVEGELLELTWKYKYIERNVENGYLNYIHLSLINKVRKVMESEFKLRNHAVLYGSNKSNEEYEIKQKTYECNDADSRLIFEEYISSESNENISQEQEEILRLWLDEGYTEREIAENLGIYQMKVNRLKAQAIAAIRENVEEDYYGTDE